MEIGASTEVDLDDLESLQKKYKSHCRVFDSQNSMIRLAAEMPVSEHEKKMALRTEKARRQSEEKQELKLRFEEEWVSYKRRRDRQSRLKSDEGREKELKTTAHPVALIKVREIMNKYFS